MRLFLAIELPDPVRDHLAALQSSLRPPLPDLRYIPRPNLHLTLQFLGETADEMLPALIDTLCPITIPVMTLAASSLLTFPPRGPLRIVAAALAGDVQPLIDLHRQLGKALATLGFTAEARPYCPHITLARSPQHPRTSASKVPPPNDVFPGPAFTVNRVTLMHSDLRSASPTYTPLAHFPPRVSEPPLSS